jgi:CheY-like chemotaxis protein
VTDDAATLQIVHHHLTDWKVEHFSAAGAVEALDIVRSATSSGTAIELVIVDDALAEGGVQALVHRIKEHSSSSTVEVVMLSAVGRSDSSPGSAGPGIYTCLTKPIVAPRLRACLESVAARIPRHVLPKNATKNTARGTVLVVEDSLVNQEVCQAMLESAGFDVDIANDGREGVERAASKRYDAVFMDLQMPGMDGFEATRRIRTEEASSGGPGRRTRIIALTANATADDREAAAAAGMDDFISKPFSQDQLVNALRRREVDTGPASPSDLDKATVERAVPDPATLDYDAVLHRCMGKRELAHRLIGKFVGSIEHDVTRIKDLLHGRDWSEAAEEVHKLKGAAAALEATQLRACLADLERDLRRGASIDVDLVAARLEKTSKDYRDAAETALLDPGDADETRTKSRGRR